RLRPRLRPVHPVAPDRRVGDPRYDRSAVTAQPSPGYTPEERARLAAHFTALEGPVFALTDLPEVVKGALFARYSRSPKSLRRLFLDEFATRDGDVAAPAEADVDVDIKRAEGLYERVFLEYGDDSVAQLGGV